MRNMRIRSARATVLVAACCALTGLAAFCGPGPGGELVRGVTDSTFVFALGDLERVQRDENLDSLQRAAARDSVLRVHHVTAAQLEAAARSVANEPQKASLLFQAIQRHALTP